MKPGSRSTAVCAVDSSVRQTTGEDKKWARLANYGDGPSTTVKLVRAKVTDMEDESQLMWFQIDFEILG